MTRERSGHGKHGQERRLTSQDLGWLIGGHGGGTAWMLLLGIHAFRADARLAALTLLSFVAANIIGLSLFLWCRRDRAGRMFWAMEGLLGTLLVFYTIAMLAFDLAGQRAILEFYMTGSRSPYSILWLLILFMAIAPLWARQNLRPT